MDDHLSRLLERHAQRTGLIHPRARSRYEPTQARIDKLSSGPAEAEPGAGPLSGVDPAGADDLLPEDRVGSTHTARQGLAETRRGTGSDVATGSTREPAAPPQASETVKRGSAARFEPVPFPAARPNKLPAGGPSASAESTRVDSSKVRPSRITLPADTSPRHLRNPDRASQATPMDRMPSTPQAMTPKQFAAGPAATPPETPPPIIRVTIGRVEVRAQPAATSPPRQPAPEGRRPAVSLDNYLHRRGGGKK